MTTTANEDAQYRCPHCRQWFVVNTLLRAHVAAQHTPTQG